MTPSIRARLTFVAASVLLLAPACDDGERSPDIEPREGQTAQFKTANTDSTFKWKGCEPPWGPDPYRADEPTEEWRLGVTARIELDANAQLVHSFLEGGGGECEEGCASLDLAWTGEVQADEVRTGVGAARAIGKCTEKAFAWSVEVQATGSFLCTCG